MIANYVPCRSCVYPCKDKENKSKYKCEIHWKNILDLIKYKVDDNDESVHSEIK